MHTRPDAAIPGPRIDWLGETTRWWDQWLRGIDTGVADEPPVWLYVQAHDVPGSRRRHTSGHWRSAAALPVPGRRSACSGSGDGTLLDAPPEPSVASARPPPAAPARPGGEFSAGGLPDYGLPLDQRADEPYALVHTGPPLAEPLELAGRPRLRLRVAASAPVALVAARLCDVAPGGSSALVAKGALNLTRRASLTDPEPLEPGVAYDVELELAATAWRLAAGHRLRLLLLTSDFPSLWPTPEPVVLEVGLGASSLVLPAVPPAAPAPPFPPPPVPHDDALDERTQVVERDALAEAVEVRMGHVTTAGGLRDRRELGMRVADADPAGAIAWGRTTMTLDGAEVVAETTVTGSREAFEVRQRLTVTRDGRPWFARTWERTVPRVLC